MAEPFRVTLIAATLALAAAPDRAAGQTTARPKAAPATPRTAEEITAAERRAVRGAPLANPAGETPELRELRRFEQSAFPGPGQGAPVMLDPEREDQALPSALRGHWGGSGDVPEELRSPEAARRRGPPPPPDSAFLRSLQMPDIPVRWEPQVLRFLEYFSKDSRGRAVMTNFLRRMGRYQAAFEQILEREHAPKGLIYVAMIESGFQAKALSNKSAGGFWQFMPPVAKAYGLEVSYWVDARRDPEQATEAAARYLQDLFQRFGSWHLAFAAFHAGYGAILSSITRFNSNDYWELCKHEAGLPWETTLYVPKILAVAIISKNRDAFGFADVVPDPPLAFDRAEVRAGTTLAAVARAAGASPETLADLNPALLRERVPPDRSTAVLRLPTGTAQLYAASIDKTRGAGDRVSTYVLRFGESIEDVAQARGISSRELRRLNGVSTNAELRGGTTIVVPANAGAGDTAALAAVPPASAPVSDQPLLVAVPERTWSYPDRERVFYRARDGDRLDDLSEVFQVAADQILEWNNLDPNAKLHSKMVLQLFVKKGFDPSGVALLDPGDLHVVTLGSEEFHALEVARRGKTRLYYTARAGDTFAKIGRRYGLAPADLARINKLSHATELADGQRVVVYTPNGELPRETAGRSVAPKRPAAAAPARTGAAGEVRSAGSAAPGTGAVRPTGKDGAGGKAAPAPVPQKSGQPSKPAGSRSALGELLPTLAVVKRVPLPADAGVKSGSQKAPAGKPGAAGTPSRVPSAAAARPAVKAAGASPTTKKPSPPVARPSAAAAKVPAVSAKAPVAKATAAKAPPLAARASSSLGRTGGPKPPARP